MLKSSLSKIRPAAPVRMWHRLLLLIFVGSPALAFGQDFTMAVTAPYPSAVDAGQDSVSYITLGTVNGFNGTVSLSCAVTPVVASGPTCTPPATATPPQQVGMSITVDALAPAGFYTLTVTGSGPAPSTTKTANVYLTVLSVSPDYTLGVTTAIFPTSVHAGFTATATVNVSPINGYSGTVTLSCSSVTPLATPAPFCSFSPAAVGQAQNYTSTLTVTTTGPTTAPPAGALLPGTLNRTAGLWPGLGPGLWPGVLWLSLPGLGLMAACLEASERRRRKFAALWLLCLIAVGLLFAPGCGSSNNTNTGLSGSTPKNTYVFTLTGTDTNGVAPSNEATPPTVSLTVN